MGKLQDLKEEIEEEEKDLPEDDQFEMDMWATVLPPVESFFFFPMPLWSVAIIKCCITKLFSASFFVKTLFWGTKKKKKNKQKL